MNPFYIALMQAVLGWEAALDPSHNLSYLPAIDDVLDGLCVWCVRGFGDCSTKSACAVFDLFCYEHMS